MTPPTATAAKPTAPVQTMTTNPLAPNLADLPADQLAALLAQAMLKAKEELAREAQVKADLAEAERKAAAVLKAAKEAAFADLIPGLQDTVQTMAILQPEQPFTRLKKGSKDERETVGHGWTNSGEMTVTLPDGGKVVVGRVTITFQYDATTQQRLMTQVANTPAVLEGVSSGD